MEARLRKALLKSPNAGPHLSHLYQACRSSRHTGRVSTLDGRGFQASARTGRVGGHFEYFAFKDLSHKCLLKRIYNEISSVIFLMVAGSMLEDRTAGC